MFDLPGRAPRRPSPPRQEGCFRTALLLGVPLVKADVAEELEGLTVCPTAQIDFDMLKLHKNALFKKL